MTGCGRVECRYSIPQTTPWARNNFAGQSSWNQKQKNNTVKTSTHYRHLFWLNSTSVQLNALSPSYFQLNYIWNMSDKIMSDISSFECLRTPLLSQWRRHHMQSVQHIGAHLIWGTIIPNLINMTILLHPFAHTATFSHSKCHNKGSVTDDCDEDHCFAAKEYCIKILY